MEERGLVLKMMRLTRSKTSDHQVYTNETFSLPAVLFNYIYCGGFENAWTILITFKIDSYFWKTEISVWELNMR